MDVNFVDAIPDDKPHCANCIHFKDEDGDFFGFCEVNRKKCPTFALCENWKNNTDCEIQA